MSASESGNHPPLAGKHVVLGVTGGIAAYKAVELCRRLIDAGAYVAPVLTEGAQRFIGAATFAALASEPAQTRLFDGHHPIPHTRLGQRTDLVLVAPATARLLSDLATGRSDDLLMATLLATEAPVMVAPAMHTEMWRHPAVVDNLALLRRRGVHVVDPEAGRLAGGDVGEGRLAAPAHIAARVTELLLSAAGGPTAGPLAGRRVLVSAGGTQEAIDPVRYLANRSTGKQGHALAEEAHRRGAEVTLVTTSTIESSPGIERHQVTSAAQMADAVFAAAAATDLVIMAAAVADFTPATVATSKLKKTDGTPSIELVPTVDILAELGRRRTPHQILVGFAAETNDVEANAKAKLERKGVDLLVANDVGAEGVGFAHDTNEVLILSRSGARVRVPLTDKVAVAGRVLDAAAAAFSHPPDPAGTSA
ncbi:MAG: bifunctional phosphopantothenoylcysteine decarboxylase/phosphopantothenate--cysteine ligase CoaBC [Candidatus Microthrix sp.]|nr:bifunctional phosphopantothenoylcysteine decarboxylase/phosphopantothenate--cysteine ligase CoaBC [Candidatus Microthrix sp.]MBK6502828.1 bifunctional phosphopantothenoylcysteine decarboxylase/phosphopantothenate--cysteine ligase CoaBC [Candidatus Microthrix sp.]